MIRFLTASSFSFYGEKIEFSDTAKACSVARILSGGPIVSRLAYNKGSFSLLSSSSGEVLYTTNLSLVAHEVHEGLMGDFVPCFYKSNTGEYCYSEVPVRNTAPNQVYFCRDTQIYLGSRSIGVGLGRSLVCVGKDSLAVGVEDARLSGGEGSTLVFITSDGLKIFEVGKGGLSSSFSYRWGPNGLEEVWKFISVSRASSTPLPHEDLQLEDDCSVVVHGQRIRLYPDKRANFLNQMFSHSGWDIVDYGGFYHLCHNGKSVEWSADVSHLTSIYSELLNLNLNYRRAPICFDLALSDYRGSSFSTLLAVSGRGGESYAYRNGIAYSGYDGIASGTYGLSISRKGKASGGIGSLLVFLGEEGIFTFEVGKDGIEPYTNYRLEDDKAVKA